MHIRRSALVFMPPRKLRPLAAAAGLVAALGTAFSSTAAGDCAAVEVHNVRPAQGHLMVAAYASSEQFGKQALTSIRVPAGEAVMRLQICGLAGRSADEVALMLFQDLDSDGRMGRNLLGMPSEPWGSSGTPGAFGPSWDSAKVALDGQAIVVRMSL